MPDPICYIAVTSIKQVKMLVDSMDDHISVTSDDGEESVATRSEFIDYLNLAEMLSIDLEKIKEVMDCVRDRRKIPTFTLSCLG